MTVRPPVPPFTHATAVAKVQAAEDAWNTRDPERVALAYTEDSIWRNRDQFFTGRTAIIEFLRQKWHREQDYVLRKELWAFRDNRIAVRFQYECHDATGRWWRSYGNELWEFTDEGLMNRREASINDVGITEAERRFAGTAPRSAAPASQPEPIDQLQIAPHSPGGRPSAADGQARRDIQVELLPGARDDLRALFELAEDSQAQLDSYLGAGRVLVARSEGTIVGHLQLVDRERGQVEIKNMAVLESHQRRGVGARLVRAAIDLVSAEGVSRVLVATAAADVGNLRFYQRQGFRMHSIERDAFTAATGYPRELIIDGIPLRDQVWLDQPVGPATRPPAGHDD
jgi:nuclear transport factor 2 (NTF2) superfamily protein/GNAT superfamily N-acetyltransferase